ncbi:sn-1-specific diacylglycerol lipase ABHD11 [Ambystoma mexicanum]|uniref:sn-1-specific diacylglycerol lipase ABHD11 n=1 Tax=Ambystoma mexicanum TaxID=8296 RepID=UPI0037E78F01
MGTRSRLLGAFTALGAAPLKYQRTGNNLFRPLWTRIDAGQKAHYSDGTRTNSSTVALAYDLFDGTLPDPPLVFLHGLFGSKSNFQSIAKVLVKKTGRKVLTLDARNHGSSPHSADITYETMSADVHRLLEQLHIQRCILIGHSMGGKTAMAVALQWPDLVAGLVSVDIAPSTTTAPISNFKTFISTMKSVHVEANIPRSTARRLAEEQLSVVVKNPTVRQFLLTNLVEIDGEYTWRIDLESISKNLPHIMGFPEFHSSYSGPTLFLGGSESRYLSSEDYPEIERLFPEADIQYIEDAGHWVHSDQPPLFITAICNFLLSL